jgi:hypothetical protein
MRRPARFSIPPASAGRVVRPRLAALAFLLIVQLAGPLSAQTVEITPLAGYRFGGDFFELATNQPVDADGAPVLGAAVNVAIGDGLSFEALFTHERARIATRGTAFTPPAERRVVVDQWLAGGRQEFDYGWARPFVSGLLGLTRYGIEGDHEMRFAIGAGGGATVALARRLGVRLDGRVFTTFVDAEARAVACSPGFCFVGIDADLVWQLEFTAGLAVAF